MLIQNLVQIGLSQKEAEVYLMLLRIGTSPASSLAQRVGMKRVTIYAVLDALGRRGLVTSEQGKNGKRYMPHDPQALLDYLAREKAALKFKFDVARTLVEELRRNLHLSERVGNFVQFHVGDKKIFSALGQNFSHSDAPIRIVFLSCSAKAYLSSSMHDFLRKFHRKGQYVELIVPKAKQKEMVELYPKFKVLACQGGSEFLSGVMIVQGINLYLLTNKSKQLGMLHIADLAYTSIISKALTPDIISS